MDTAVVAKLQQQVLTWDYFEMYDANKQSDAVKETLTRPPNTFSSPEASAHASEMTPAAHLQTFVSGRVVLAIASVQRPSVHRRHAEADDRLSPLCPADQRLLSPRSQEYVAAFRPLLLDECAALLLRGGGLAEQPQPQAAALSGTEQVGSQPNAN